MRVSAATFLISRIFIFSGKAYLTALFWGERNGNLPHADLNNITVVLNVQHLDEISKVLHLNLTKLGNLFLS
jgi:hypothetical protein